VHNFDFVRKENVSGTPLISGSKLAGDVGRKLREARRGLANNAPNLILEPGSQAFWKKSHFLSVFPTCSGYKRVVGSQKGTGWGNQKHVVAFRLGGERE
jgi:hypothetical protein